MQFGGSNDGDFLKTTNCTKKKNNDITALIICFQFLETNIVFSIYNQLYSMYVHVSSSASLCFKIED